MRAFVVGEEALVDSKVGRLCDEAEVSEEDEDALQQLPLHEGGGLFGQFKSSSLNGGTVKGVGVLLRGGGLPPDCHRGFMMRVTNAMLMRHAPQYRSHPLSTPSSAPTPPIPPTNPQTPHNTTTD